MSPAPARDGEPAAATPAARVTGLVKTFGATKALAGITAELPTGRILGLVGPDGAGKTTLIRLLAGLDPVALLHRHLRDPAGDAESELHLMHVDVAEEGERGVGIVRPVRAPEIPAHGPQHESGRGREPAHAGTHAARSVPRSCVSGVVVPPAPTTRPPPQRSSSSSDNEPGAPDIVLGFTFRTRVPATNG